MSVRTVFIDNDSPEKHLDIFENIQNGVSFFIRNESDFGIEFVAFDFETAKEIHRHLGIILKRIKEDGKKIS
jgi:hypothetical protein